MQILVLNGANLDALSRRDPKVYGGLSLNDSRAASTHGRTSST